MHIAISTSSLSPDTPTALERAAALGFTHVEINLQQKELGYGFKRKTNARFYRRLRSLLDEKGLSVWSTTTPPLTQLQMFSERARKDLLMSSSIASGILGGQLFVLRVLDILQSEAAAETYFQEKQAPPVINGYDEAWVQAVNRRVVVAVRNEDYYIGMPLVNRPERIDKLTADLAIGWALDVPEALKRGDLSDWFNVLADRLAVGYVYDVSGDDRLAPRGEAWRNHLAALSATRLKALVIQSTVGQSDTELKESRAYLHALLEAVG